MDISAGDGSHNRRSPAHASQAEPPTMPSGHSNKFTAASGRYPNMTPRGRTTRSSRPRAKKRRPQAR
eukprot:8096848-Pyramimonas_sp.AAC.1